MQRIAAMVMLVALTACSEAETVTAGFATAKATIGPLTDSVLATGTVQTVQSVEISSQLSGRVEEVLVDYNDTVTAGQPLARLDPQRFFSRVEELKAALAVAEAELASVTASLAGAKAQHQEAERDWQRKNELAKKGTVSQSQAERAETELRQSEATLNTLDADQNTRRAAIMAARASLRQAEIDLERTTIRAPIDGIVIKRSIEPGQTVAASLEAPELFIIADELNRVEIHASVDEADIGKIGVDQAVRFNVDAFPARRFVGSVAQIRKHPQIAQNVVTYTVVIDADNPGEILLPGMTAIVEIVTARLDSVLLVPNAALRFELDPKVAVDRPNERAVWILSHGTPERVVVGVGYSDGEFTEIRAGGISEGDTLVIGHQRLSHE